MISVRGRAFHAGVGFVPLRGCIDQLLDASGHVGEFFGPRIHDEPFPKGFSLPRDTPKYNGSMKPEDSWID